MQYMVNLLLLTGLLYLNFNVSVLFQCMLNVSCTLCTEVLEHMYVVLKIYMQLCIGFLKQTII